VFFAENWEDKEGFQHEVYVEISSVVDKWVEALRKIAFARGETGFNYIDYYTSLARMRGLEMGVEYAEVLMRPLYSRRTTIGQLDEL